MLKAKARQPALARSLTQEQVESLEGAISRVCVTAYLEGKAVSDHDIVLADRFGTQMDKMTREFKLMGLKVTL